MRKLITAVIALAIMATTAAPAFAADYNFETGDNTLSDFGGATSYDGSVTPDPLTQNTRRNKDAAVFPPPYGIFSGDIPTDPTSPYHDNLPESGFVPVDQELPGMGGFLPPTSSMDTAPQYYADGSIGSLYVSRTGKTIKVYEGEDLSNLKIGAGHFASTSAWDGNVALCGHNRGSYPFFSFVKNTEIGDRLTYTTKYGTRTYEVYYKAQISETDYTGLSWSGDNMLTLITCIENTPELRWLVRAREI
jgi:sortase A